MRKLFCVVALMSIATEPAHACEYDIIYFKLPSESKEAADTRADQRFEQTGVLIDYRQQLDMLQNAKQVYVAVRVSKPTEHTREPEADELLLKRMPVAYVRPVRAIKGELPSTDLRLIDTQWLTGGACRSVHDGRGASAKVGDPLIVFEGLENVPMHGDHPRDVFSELADKLVLHELQSEIADFLNEQVDE